ncbi:MAG: carboxypeptidase-like regulatory domain-containing protein [Planctomycetia bacterium]|nr:carboxypeptidase-like regulatory domain-containing protein [Planctomycetia bacterium]
MRLLFCGCLLFLIGCGGGGPELPVSGIVTLDGKPMANVTVRFFPDTDTDPTSSGYAETGTDGKFVITSGKGKQGLVAGRYKVTVSKGKAQTVSSEEGAGAVIEGLDIKDEFPPCYSDPAQTILAFSVTGDGQPIEIKLDSKKK